MYLDAERLQWCWAHLKRDIQRLIDSPDGQLKHYGGRLMARQRERFDYWRQYKAGKIRWSTFQGYVRPIRREFEDLLVSGKHSGNAQLAGFCEGLHAGGEHLWTFTKIEGIEPTNNTAERALRDRGDPSEVELRDAECCGEPFLGTDADGLGDVPAVEQERLRVPDRSDAVILRRPARPLVAADSMKSRTGP